MFFGLLGCVLLPVLRRCTRARLTYSGGREVIQFAASLGPVERVQVPGREVQAAAAATVVVEAVVLWQRRTVGAGNDTTTISGSISREY